jgi:hypothetical protein
MNALIGDVAKENAVPTATKHRDQPSATPHQGHK